MQDRKDGNKQPQRLDFRKYQMDNPIISVIIPVYNEEKYIDRCMKSLWEQTYDDLQIIMINGGSVDSSPAKCDEWAVRWNGSRSTGTVEVIHTENNGVSASRNLGLERARGEYITFIDGDDWLEPDAIGRMYDAVVSVDSDLAGMEFQSRTSCGNEDGRGPEAEQQEHTETLDSGEFIRTRLVHGDTHCWGRLYKKEILGEQRFKEGLTIGEDMLFFLEYVMKCRKVTCMDYKGYNYFRNPGGAMCRPYTPAAYDQVLCWQEAGRMLGTEDADCADTELRAAIQANILISVMLTAGRIAIVSTNERMKYCNPDLKPYGDTVDKLRAEIKCNCSKDAVSLLGWGYRFKIAIFVKMPKIYLMLYHLHKA